MISNPALLKVALGFGGIYVIRLLARLRTAMRERAQLTTPLVDPVLLETTFAARDGDDANLLAEIRDSLSHLNRQCYAEEFWKIDEQLGALDARLPKGREVDTPTHGTAIVGFVNRWLQIVGVRTCMRLVLPDALPQLHILKETLDPKNTVDSRLRLILDEAISTLGEK